ncbi:hypothetical protein C8R43DRAFT_634488 [Mycena crocata]|nr:hypothetical protein C8R43DRAFT_634488 [Mycena crocata]
MFSSAFPTFLLALALAISTSVNALPTHQYTRRDALSDTGLSLASWIWLPEPDPLVTAPTGSVAFIRTFTTPTGKTATSALISMTVDNNYTLWVNGQPIAASGGPGEDGWETAEVITAALNTSANVFSVLGVNANPDSPGADNPAGLLAAVRIRYTDGTNDTILSDGEWLVSGTVPADFPLPADLSKFGKAAVATRYGSGPWGTSIGVHAPDLSSANLTGSQWIWSTKDASNNAPAGTIGFRKTVATPGGKTATSASILASVDNHFDLYVNGQYIASPPFDSNVVGSTATWGYAQRFSAELAASSNVFTVIAQNFEAQQAGGGPSAAGFVAALLIQYSDGTSSYVRTDESWLTGAFTSAGTFLVEADAKLVPAVVQGPYGMAPWGQIGTADVLNALDVPGNNAAALAPGTTTAPPSLTRPIPASTVPLPSFTASSSPTPSTGGAIRASDAPMLTLFFAFATYLLL